MNKKTLLLAVVVCVMVLCYNPKPVFGAAPPTDAECVITVNVASIVEWSAEDFAPIDLDDQSGSQITSKADVSEGFITLTLWTNSNITLGADNTLHGPAELTHSRGDLDGNEDTLVTKYMLSTDGDGDPQTGADEDAVTASGSDVWEVYNTFLTPALAVTHFNTDGNVIVRLDVQATNDDNNVADVGLYEATQTITATWIEDN